MKLNLGCSVHAFHDFVNVDIERPPWADDPYAPPFVQADVTQRLPFEDNSCDLVLCHHLLEHMDYRQGIDFIKECRRVLRPGGSISIAVPNFDWLVARYYTVGQHDFDLYMQNVEMILYTCEPRRTPEEWASGYFNVHKAAYYPALLRGLATHLGLNCRIVPEEEMHHLSGYADFQLCAYFDKPLPPT